MKDSENKILRNMQVTENESSEDRDDTSTIRQDNQSANSTPSDRIQLEILQLLKELKNDNNNSRKRNRDK